MGNREVIYSIANDIMLNLLKEGFNIQSYRAYTSNTVYMRFDYGAAYSLRISDHRGKLYIRYTFNLDIKKKGYEVINQSGTTRRYYGIDRVDKLIHDIVDLRNKQIEKCGGIDEYEKHKRYHKDSYINRKGFWHRVKEYKINDNTGEIEAV